MGTWWTVFWVTTGIFAQADLRDTGAPPVLDEWAEWVLHGHEGETCPTPFDNPERHICRFPHELILDLEDTGGRFRASYWVLFPGPVQLPGDSRLWPQKARTSSRQKAVVLHQGLPTVYLDRGESTVEGEFSWSKLPEFLVIPKETGILKVTIHGEPVPQPSVDPNGHRLWIQTAPSSAVGQNRLTTRVFRLLDDQVPAELITEIRLEVSGENREVTFDPVLPAGFTPLSLDSPLPAFWDPEGQLKIKLRRGQWTLRLRAIHSQRLDGLTIAFPENDWPDHEIWTFRAHEDIRQVQVKGMLQVDPQQTLLPEEWRELPAYRVVPGDHLELQQTQRGYEEPEPDQITLNRTMWLDFDGQGFTLNDHMAGQIKKTWRLDVLPPVQLGRVTLNAEAQLITGRADRDAHGVELRQGGLNLEAEARIPMATDTLPAVGWDCRVNQIQTQLHLPPGWNVFMARGPDSIRGTWMDQWDLFEIFLLLVVVAAVARLFSWRAAAITALTLVLIQQEPLAPRWSVITLLILIALQRVIPEGRLQRSVDVIRKLNILLLVLICIPFVVKQIQSGLFPHLSPMWSTGTDTGPSRSRQQGMWLNEAVDMEPERPVDKMVVVSQKVEALDYLSSKRKAVQLMGDPNAAVQTGPGLPHWSWHTVYLAWNGPVTPDETLNVLLVSPALNLLLLVLRMALLLAFLCLITQWKPRILALKGAAKVAAVPMILLAVTAARADTPTQAILDELRQRLLEPPECMPHCADIASFHLNLQDQDFVWILEVHAAADVLVPLPGPGSQWFISQVTLNGQRARGLLMDQEQHLNVWVPSGVHVLRVQGQLISAERNLLAFPLKPYQLTTEIRGWNLEGVHTNGAFERQLQLIRISPAAQSEEERYGDLRFDPFLQVQRRLILGLNWQVETTVSRISPADNAILVEIPILPGESVTTPGIRVSDQRVQLHMNAPQTERTWQSSLDMVPEIQLRAPSADALWSETWILDASPVWHVETKGIPVLHMQNNEGLWKPTWLPWPEEEVQLAITRPEQVEGATMTVQQTRLHLTPGRRMTHYSLEAQVRCSLGDVFSVQLPPHSEPENLTIDGQSQPFNTAEDSVRFTLAPGSHDIDFQWQHHAHMGLFFKVPVVSIGRPGINHHVQLSLPRDRWVLLLGGGDVGPVVLFWPFLMALLLVSYALSTIPYVPLKSWQWFLLGLGLTQVHVTVIALVFGWMIALGARKHYAARITPLAFNILQIGLIMYTVLTLFLLLVSIHQGLLGTPSMQIAGNGSMGSQLMWYQEQSMGILPRVWVTSVSLWIYRLMMLAWSLWLSFSLIRWIKWGYACWTEGAVWRSRTRPAHSASRMPPPPPPSTVAEPTEEQPQQS